MDTNGMSQLQDVFDDANAYGERLAYLLATISWPDDVKDAWAALVPSMNLAQLQRFENILRAQLSDEVQNELEDSLLALRAEVMKRDLALAGSAHVAHAALDQLEQRIDALERAGGKRDV